jgi:hypothetical protein
VVASTSTGVKPMSLFKSLVSAQLLLTSFACGEVTFLAISAGSPVAGVVHGVITFCGNAVASPELRLRVQQDRPEQAHPVDARIGPFTGNPDGSYLIEVGPSFAVPGPATVQLEVTSARMDSVALGTLNFTLGTPAHDSLRLDADLGAVLESCGHL